MPVTVDEDEVVAIISGLERVVADRAGPDTGAPEVAWGDTFFWVVDDDGRPVGPQPFATVVTKDYPGEPSSGPEAPGAFRLNLDVGRERFAQQVGYPPSAWAEHAGALHPAVVDVVMPHPVYGAHGWVCVVRPGPASRAAVEALVGHAHRRAVARWQRRVDRS